VFAGGWTLEAAEAICARRVPRDDVLTTWLGWSISRWCSSKARTAWRGTVCSKRCASSLPSNWARRRKDGVVRDRHLDWCLALAERADVELTGPLQSEWLEVLEREHDNLRSALRWSIASGSLEKALGLAVACSYFWEIRGHRYRSEGRRWLEEALAASAVVSPTGRARARYWAGIFAAEQYDFDGATAIDASLQVWLEIGNNRGIAESQLGLGIMFRDLGEYARAEDVLADSLPGRAPPPIV
jgi:non-specific serine/threonine protein kinase